MSSKYHWFALLVLPLTLGCSGDDSGRPKTYPVTGSVTLKGTAVEGAVVTFHLMEGKGNAIGSTDANGKYKLSTYSPSDGAVPGQYKVSIAKYAEGKAPPASSTPPPGQPASGEIDIATYVPPSESSSTGRAGSGEPKNLLPAKYANADTSALRATVSEGKNSFDFELN